MRVCARVTGTLAVDHGRPCRDEGLFAVDRYYESRLREAAMRVGCKVVTVEDVYKRQGQKNKRNASCAVEEAFASGPGDEIYTLCGLSIGLTAHTIP